MSRALRDIVPSNRRHRGSSGRGLSQRCSYRNRRDDAFAFGSSRRNSRRHGGNSGRNSGCGSGNVLSGSSASLHCFAYSGLGLERRNGGLLCGCSWSGCNVPACRLAPGLVANRKFRSRLGHIARGRSWHTRTLLVLRLSRRDRLRLTGRPNRHLMMRRELARSMWKPLTWRREPARGSSIRHVREAGTRWKRRGSKALIIRRVVARERALVVLRINRGDLMPGLRLLLRRLRLGRCLRWSRSGRTLFQDTRLVHQCLARRYET